MSCCRIRSKIYYIILSDLMTRDSTFDIVFCGSTSSLNIAMEPAPTTKIYSSALSVLNKHFFTTFINAPFHVS